MANVEEIILKDAGGTAADVTASNALKVDGSAVTQPVSGTVTINAIPAGTNNIGDVDVLSLPSIPTGANVIGAVTQSGTWNIGTLTTITSLPALAAGTNNIGDVDVLTLPALVAGTALIGKVGIDQTTPGTTNAVAFTNTTIAVTNAGTFPVQIDGAALTSFQLLDDVVATLGTTTYTEAATKGNIIAAVRRDADTTLVDNSNELGPLQMDANGRLKVEAFSGETLPVSLTSTTVTGTVAVTQSGTWDEVGINDSGNSITVDAPTGTPVNVQIGNATLTVGVIDETGAAAVDALAVGGGTAHDAVDSGNPVKVGAKAASALPTAVANSDRTNNISDLWGRQLFSHIDPGMQVAITKTAFNTTSTATGGAMWTPASGKRIAITSLTIGTYGTTAARVIIWIGASGDTTYTAGTDHAVVIASFAPSATVKPGLVFTPAVPVFSATADHILRITTDAAISIDVTWNGYEF